jgi:hypothetical protein
MKSFAPGLPAPADLAIDRLKLVVSPGRFCQFMGSLATEPNAWTLDLGTTTLTIKNVQFDLLIEQQQDGFVSSGGFGGELNIGENISISANYTIPGEFVIRGSVGRLRFASLLSGLTSKKVSLPKGLDFTLTDASVMIKKNASGLVFQLASNIEGFGYMAFEVKKTNGQWGAAAGISLEAELGLSDIPCLKVLKPLDKVAIMQDFTLVVSSYDGPQFRFPDVAALENPLLPTAKVLKSAGHSINNIGNSLKMVFDLNSSEMKSCLKGAGYSASTVDKFVGRAFLPLIKRCHYSFHRYF